MKKIAFITLLALASFKSHGTKSYLPSQPLAAQRPKDPRSLKEIAMQPLYYGQTSKGREIYQKFQNQQAQQALNYQLLEGANTSNLEKISQSLKSGADANATDPYGYTPLMIASNKGQLGAVETLIEHGANPNQARNFNYGANTALMRASKNGHLDIVIALLKAGANAGAVDKHKQTALMLAKENNHLQVVEILTVPALLQMQDTNAPSTEYFKSGVEALIKAILEDTSEDTTEFILGPEQEVETPSKMEDVD